MKNPLRKNLEKKELDDSLRLIIKSSFVVFIGIIISNILNYIYRITIARSFGPEVYGLFSLAFTIASFAIAIASLGFADGLLRFIPILRAKKKYGEIGFLFKKTARTYLIIGAVFSFILFFFSDSISYYFFNKPALSILLKIISFAVFFNLFLALLLNTIRSFEKIAWFSFLSNIFNNLSKVLVLWIMILIGFGSGGVASAFSYTSAAFLTLILGYLVCRYKIKEVFADYEKKDYSSLNKEFFNYSWPIVFYSIISTIFFSIDIFSLGYYKSASAVGIYNAAAPIAGLMGLIPTLFMQLFFPMINRAYSNKNYNLIEQTSKQITKWIFMITLPAFILLFFFPGAALNILFGADYLPAENALRLLLLSSFISAIFIVSSNLMLMLGKSRLILFNMMISAILNLTLNSLLIPMDSIFYLDNSNGLIGASLATLLSVLFFNLLFIFQTKKYLLFIPFRRKMINLLLISVIPSAALFYARRIMPKNIFSIIILSLSFILIYWFFALIFHSLDKNDIMIINSFWQRIKSFKGK